MTGHRKLIAAFVGVLCFVANKKFGVDFLPVQTELVDVLIGSGTLFSVWFLRNNSEEEIE